MIALYLLATTEHSLELYSLATKREQAKRIIDTAASFAINCPGLTEEQGGDIQVRHNMLRGRATRSTMESIASSVRTADSLEGRLYIADECGRYTDDVLGKMAIALAKPGTESRQLLMVTTRDKTDRTPTTASVTRGNRSSRPERSERKPSCSSTASTSMTTPSTRRSG